MFKGGLSSFYELVKRTERVRQEIDEMRVYWCVREKVKEADIDGASVNRVNSKYSKKETQ